jgi:hypothetical protein
MYVLHGVCLITGINCLPCASTWVHTGLVGSVLLIYLVFYVVLLLVVTFWVPFCDVRYDFRIKTMFGSFLPPALFVGGLMSYLRCLLLLAYSSVQHILRCVFIWLVYHMLAVSLDCSFLIAPSVFSKVYVCWLLVSRFCVQFYCH